MQHYQRSSAPGLEDRVRVLYFSAVYKHVTPIGVTAELVGPWRHE